MNSSVDTFISETESTPRSIFPIERNLSETKITTKNTFVIVVSDYSKFNDTSGLRYRLKELQRVRVEIRFGIFFQAAASIEDLQILFEWCKVNLIVDIFATISLNQSFNILTFNPFERQVTMVNLTSSTYDNFFANRKSNYKRLSVDRFGGNYGHSLLWPTAFDIEELYMEFRREHTDPDSDEFENGINVNPGISGECDTRVYPLAMLPQVIVVPLSLPYSDFTAYLQTFTSDKFFVYALIMLGVLMLLLTLFRYANHRKVILFQSVTDVLNLLINDNLRIRYQQLSLGECYVIVPLTFAGLVFVNGFLSSLESYLTRPVYEAQMNSIEKIYRSELPIFTWHQSADVVKALRIQTELPNWNNSIVHARDYDLANDIISYKRIAFIASSTTANLLIETQKRLNIRAYHNTQIPIGRLFLWYPLDDRFVFWERLNEIVLYIQCAGLYDQWERENFARFEMKIVRKNRDRFTIQSDGHSTDESLYFPIFIVYGWNAGVVLFIVEIIWKKLCDLGILHRSLIVC